MECTNARAPKPVLIGSLFAIPISSLADYFFSSILISMQHTLRFEMCVCARVQYLDCSIMILVCTDLYRFGVNVKIECRY